MASFQNTIYIRLESQKVTNMNPPVRIGTLDDSKWSLKLQCLNELIIIKRKRL